MQTAFQNPDWIVPDWPVPPHVHALCTTRQGGCSAAPFDTLNLGDHVGDSPEAVAANRRRLQDSIAACTPHARNVFLQQVHGTKVALLDTEGLCADTHTNGDAGGLLCADASVACGSGQVCTIMVADCLPVLFTNRQGSVVAAAHAGWRGLAGTPAAAGGTAGSAAAGKGVLESVLECFWAAAQAQQAQPAMNSVALKTSLAPEGQAADTLVWLGPCIGPQAFEVGAEVRAEFCAHDAAAAQHFQSVAAGSGTGGKYLADLAALARQRLRAAGVTQIYGNDSTAAWCTVGNPSRFFSHRRDSARLGGSGRFAVCIWRD